MNQRHNSRIPAPLAGELTAEMRSHAVEVRNISLTGVRLAGTLPPLTVGAPCRLRLRAEVGDPVATIAVDGRVVYSDHDSCAVSFTTIDTRDFAELTRWLGRHADEPTALRDEIESGAIPTIAEWKPVLDDRQVERRRRARKMSYRVDLA
jgi:hypothetical protein